MPAAAHIAAVLLACILGPLASALAQDQDSAIPVTFGLLPPAPTCSVSSVTALSFRTAIRPISGSNRHVEANAENGSISPGSGFTSHSGGEVGYARVTASNSSSLTVGATFPDDLGGLTYTGAWAVSESASSGYSSISGGSDTQTGLSGDETRHYRFGGRVSGLSSSTGVGTYDGTISLSVTCQ